ncbi:hypothetical protein SAMN05421833_1407 [Microbispora rosea]|uniref:Uncharacterized protein n=1 Tax=Microbispora rosea TaxID=58117 RepID=A0A1N7H926_9ACTN|nr:hypothetical protein SAMN05421833_1407 [Microbispora rosea]
MTPSTEGVGNAGRAVASSWNLGWCRPAVGVKRGGGLNAGDRIESIRRKRKFTRERVSIACIADIKGRCPGRGPVHVSAPERGNMQFSGVLRIGSPDAPRSGPEIGVLREGGAHGGDEPVSWIVGEARKLPAVIAGPVARHALLNAGAEPGVVCQETAVGPACGGARNVEVADGHAERAHRRETRPGEDADGGADLTFEGVAEGAGQRLVQAGGLRLPGLVDAPPSVMDLGRVLLVAAAVPFLDKGETVPFAEAAGGGVLL